MGRWGFELDDDELVDEAARGRESEPAEEMLIGQDDAGFVTVVVTGAGGVRDVRLADGWRRSIDPRDLHVSVVDAVNAAIANAVAVRLDSPDSERVLPARVPTGHGALTRDDLSRLIDAATVDIERTIRPAATAPGGTVTVRSPGGHVVVTGAKQQVHHVDIEPSWAAAARDTEIAVELTDGLAAFADDVAPENPRSSALDELTALIADPQRTLRRLGLPVGDDTVGAAR